MLFPLIKIISTVLVTGALALELGHRVAGVPWVELPQWLQIFGWIGRFALVSHALEGIIAAIYASRRQRQPLPYAIYTFFVGTVGLVELFDDRLSYPPLGTSGHDPN